MDTQNNFSFVLLMFFPISTILSHFLCVSILFSFFKVDQILDIGGTKKYAFICVISQIFQISTREISVYWPFPIRGSEVHGKYFLSGGYRCLLHTLYLERLCGIPIACVLLPHTVRWIYLKPISYYILYSSGRLQALWTPARLNTC